MLCAPSFRVVALAGFGLCLSACAVGPEFVPPAPPSVATFGAKAPAAKTVAAKTALGASQKLRSGGEVPADWWRLFGSAPLNHLMTQAVDANPSIQAARASLRAAEETAQATWGDLLPALSGSASAGRSKQTGTEKPSNLYQTALGLSFAPDIFGAARHTRESAQASAEAARFELEATHLSLTAAVATTAVQEAFVRERLKTALDIVETQKKQRDLVRARFEAGAIAKTALLAQEAALAESQAAVPEIEKTLAQTRHLLAVLTGRFPGEDVGATFALSGFSLPEDVPVSLPSSLVSQRPDVRAALANLKAANANVGIAMAARMPSFSLTGSFGVGAGAIADMFSPTTALWGLAAGIAQPLFKGGKLLHQKRASEAAFDQSAALYRSAVLSAFKDVADALEALESDAKTLAAQAQAERAAAASLDLATKQFEAGATSHFELLAASTAHKQSRLALVQAQAARLTDTIALFQTLGGGWWNKRAESK